MAHRRHHPQRQLNDVLVLAKSAEAAGLSMADRAEQVAAYVNSVIGVSPTTRRAREIEATMIVRPEIASHIDALLEVTTIVYEHRRAEHEATSDVAFPGRLRHVFLHEVCPAALDHPKGTRGLLSDLRRNPETVALGSRRRAKAGAARAPSLLPR